MAIFGHSKFVPVFLGKIVRIKLEEPFLVILNLCQSFWEKLSEKNQNGQKCCSKFYLTIFLYISLLSIMVLKVMKKSLKNNCQKKHFCQKNIFENKKQIRTKNVLEIF